MRFLWLLLLPLMALAQSNIPQDQVKIGRPQTSDDKQLVFDTNDGVSNKKLSVEKTSKKLKWDGNNVQIGDGAAVDKEILFNGSTGKYLKWDASSTQFEMNEDLGLDSGVLKTNTIDTFSGTETSIEQDARVKGKLNIGTGNNEIRVSGGNLEFSNDGALYKKIGSGSGGGEGGVNLLENGSFEDGLTPGWTNVGGTLTQQTYLNGPEGDTKYAQYVASGAGQYFETTAKAIPDFLNGGCLAYVDYSTSDNNAFKISVFDGATEINSQTLPTTDSKWLGSPFVSILCPATGNLVKLRIESLSAGTILADKGYLGSENRTVSVSCQGTTECEDELSASVNTSAVITSQTLDFLTSCSGTTTKICNFKTGLFSTTPSCQVTAIHGGNNFYYGNILSVSSSQIQMQGYRSDSSIAVNTPLTLSCQKQGADFAAAKPQTAVTSDQSGWFIDANIGGANPTLGTANVTTYSPIENASLDMVVRSNSAPAQIGCSSTNTTTGLTCAAGNESISVSWVPPYTGYFDVCFSGSWQGDVSGAASQVSSYFQVVETPINAQTILAEGGQRAGVALSTTATTIAGGSQVNTCGTFLVSDTSRKMHRLFYEQSTTSATDSRILADRAAGGGQRDIRVTVRPSTQNIARPVLTGEQVTAPGGDNFKVCQYVWGGAGSLAAPSNCTANPCTLYYDRCDSVTGSVAWTATGDTNANTVGWKPNTVVTCSSQSNGGLEANPIMSHLSDGSGQLVVRSRIVNGTTATNGYLWMECKGERQ